MNQKACTFEVEITKTVRLNYLLFLPKGYQDSSKKWPLILFLHGAGERGDDLALVQKHGIPKIVEQQPDFPFITVSPQCPEDAWWSSKTTGLMRLLDDVVTKYAVDTRRIYLTGMSMGGYGTWHLAVEHPDRFAAIAPVCGGFFGPPRFVCALKETPVWTFHGAKDPVVPLEESEKLVKALRECGGDVRFTIYPEAEHDAWTETYDNPELYTWFLEHSR